MERLDFSFYCGKSYLLADVKDLTHTNNQIDPVPENNVNCIPIDLGCPQGKSNSLTIGIILGLEDKRRTASLNRL